MTQHYHIRQLTTGNDGYNSFHVLIIGLLQAVVIARALG